MKYVGSKNRISKYIVPILQDCIDKNSIEIYYEPFVGGANLIDKIHCKERIGNDIHPQLIAMFNELQKGWQPPSHISEEEYNKVRDNDYSLVGLSGVNLYNKTAGIIGSGKIGQAMARICKGFGMNVILFDPYPNEVIAAQIGARYESLEYLLKDKEHIERANKLHWSEWNMINEDEAETSEAKEILHRIMMTLYHREEYSINGEC